MWTPLSKQDNLMNDVFTIMLDLEEPWKLVVIENDPQEEAWHLFIDLERGALFPCPHCATPWKAYDLEKKKWRHLDIWKWKTYIHARVPPNRLRKMQ